MRPFLQFGPRPKYQAAVLLVILFSVRVKLAHASGHLGGIDETSAELAVIGAGVVLPSETGALVDSGTHFILGWSWQVPFTPSLRHRIVGGVNWVPGVDRHRWGGRVGYRIQASDSIVAGMGVAFDHAATTWSPEFGIRFPPHRHWDMQFDPSLHVIVRADVASRVNQLQGMSVLLGWTFF
jgi:hypothetical protein